jgi:DDE superfamily endonuclease
MADLLLAERDAPLVGKNWTTNFIKRRTEIKTKFSRKYNYKRAQCEGPLIIGDWFKLVRNTIGKYGIQEEDIYNFDEAGFLMGVIATAKVVTSSQSRNRPTAAQPGNREWVSIIQGINSYGWSIPPFIIFKGGNHLSAWYEDSGLPRDWVITLSENGWTTNEIGYQWIQHFEKHTRTRTKGTYRLLILDGHESHLSVEFQQYCQENHIITLCMPPHSSHILQPLDVGCFSPLRASYGKQIETPVRNRINHITKLEFLPAFKEAFRAALTEQNIKSGFRATGLVPYDPDNVLSHLDLRLRTSTPPLIEEPYWTSKTPQNATELECQTTHLKNRVVKHQDSSPTSINEAFDQLVKGAQIMVHSTTLLRAEVKALQEANQVVGCTTRIIE